MTLWPWMSLAAGPVVAVLPPGNSVIHSAFFSGEQLSRTLGQFVVFSALGIWVGVVVLEWLVRYLILRHRRATLNASAQKRD